MSVTVRHPAVAGRFYSRNPGTLLADLHSYISPRQETISALGCVVPHAGYIYSGRVAGAVYARLNIPRQCFLLCPNHTGMGPPLSIMSAGAWETPLGSVPIDSALANKIKQRCSLLSEDVEAHRAEHGAEVQLPFLQALRPDFTFVPIALGTAQFELLENLGQAMAEVLAAQNDRVLMIASSDMNHYESDPVTRIKDHKAIEPILALDARGLFDVVMKENISMCGFGPAVAMLTAARQLGATAAELVQYATSGDVCGDHDTVVGYAGIVVR
jgi:AmmeMemoRadiSam system protein B